MSKMIMIFRVDEMTFNCVTSQLKHLERLNTKVKKQTKDPVDKLDIRLGRENAILVEILLSSDEFPKGSPKLTKSEADKLKASNDKD